MLQFVLLLGIFLLTEYVYYQYVNIIVGRKALTSKAVTLMVLLVVPLYYIGWAYFSKYSTDGTIEITTGVKIFGIAVVLFAYLIRVICYCIVYKAINKKLILLVFSFESVSFIFQPVIKFFGEPSTINTIIIEYGIPLMVLLALLVVIRLKKLEEAVYEISFSILNNIKAISFVAVVIALTKAVNIYSAAIPKDNSAISIIKFIGAFIIFISIFGMIGSYFKSLVIMNRYKEVSEVLEKQLGNQAEHYKKMNTIYDEMRHFRHDYNNHMMCIESLINEKKFDEAKKYIEDVGPRYDNKSKYYDTGNIILNAILTDKNEKAEKCNSSIEFTGMVPVKGINNSDLCVIFANAFDNAIEACEKGNPDLKKIINVEAKCNRGIMLITVSNPIFEDIKMEMDGTIFTSKKDAKMHGMGIQNIRNAVKKYDGHVEISTSDGIFKLNIDMRIE